MKLRELLFPLFCLVSLTLPAQVISDFSASDEGWLANYLPGGSTYTPAYSSTGGNPGGYISYTTAAAVPGAAFYFQAPAKFLTAFLTSYRQNLSFDIFISAAGSDNTSPDLVLWGAGTYLYYFLPVKPPAGVWTTINIPLDETAPGWHVSSFTGPAPTREQIKFVISNIGILKVRGKFVVSGPAYTFSMDNFLIHTPTYQTPPTISGISPTSGIPNTTVVTITGTNFNTTPAQNLVRFGSVTGTVLTANSTQITVKVPVSATLARITVLDLSTNLSAQSNVNFSPLFNNNGDAGGRIIPASFNPPAKLPLDVTTSNGVFSAGDIDGDGFVDIVVGENNKNEISIFRNLHNSSSISTSSFAAKVSFGMLYSGKGNTAIADFDGDGKQDIACGSGDGSTARIALFRNTSTPGTISFAAPDYINASSYADGPIQVADIDGDGRVDLLSTFDNSSGGATAYFTVFLNLSAPGDIEFAAYGDYDYNVIGQSGAISTGDFDNDGKIDVAVISGFDSEVFVARNTSTIGLVSFQTPFTIITGASPHGIVIADFDNDNKVDLAFNGYAANGVVVIKNNYVPGPFSATSFAAPVYLVSPVFANAGRVSAGDMNGDGKIDVVLAGSADVAVFENNGVTGTIDNNTFLQGTPYLGIGGFKMSLVADFDGDNKLDMAFDQSGGATPYNIAIYQNMCFPAPKITTVSPGSGAAGSIVALSGTSFNTGLAAPVNTFRDGPLQANGTTTSNTSSTITLPVSATNDRLSITTHGLTALSAPYPVTFSTTRVINATSLAPPAVITLSSNVNETVTLADFDNDGRTDVGVVDGYHTGKVFRNTQATSGGAIVPTSLTQNTTTLSCLYGMTPLDIDGDGTLDISSGYYLYQNNSTSGSITFNTGVALTTSINQTTTADFNNDGKIDIAGITASTNLFVYENRCAIGPFFAGVYPSVSTTGVTLTRPAGNGDIVSADFDNDGNVDIATSNTGLNNWSYYRNLGVKGIITATSFGTRVDVASGVGAYGITVSDFDRDGKVDVAIANNGDLFVSVYRNTSTPGSISFAAVQKFTVVTASFDLKTADLDGDGKDEIVVIHQNGTGSISLLQNTSTSGTISFATTVNIPMTQKPLELGLADINQDNKPDLVVVANSLFVYENIIPSILITIAPQPIDAQGCQNTTVSYTTGATGTSNITYQWQKSPLTPVSFTDLADGSGIAGSKTSTLTLDLSQTQSADQFRYRAEISGDLTAPVFTNDAGLTIQPLPSSVPGVTNVSVCPGSSATLTATGAANGFFRWYPDATTTNSITDAVNSTYTTPDLTATTSYYVSITNGTCETNRVQVTATIGVCDNAPVVESATVQIDAGGVALVPLDNLISDPDGNIDLSTLKITSPPGSKAAATIDSDGNLRVDYTGSKFIGVDQITIEVCDKTSKCTSQTILIDVGGALLVYNGISPDGDGKNDTWVIAFIDELTDTKENHVEVFSRWGDRVFEATNYDNKTNAFAGVTNSGGQLPSGIYFYTITFAGSRPALKGYLSLKRN